MTMELGWDSRPSSIVNHPRDWHDHQQPAAGPSSNAPPSAFVNSASISQRRRSSAAHIPPAAPPPSQPIPNVPPRPTSSAEAQEGLSDSSPPENMYLSQAFTNGRHYTNPLQRPTASAKLSAVAAFSQARHMSPLNQQVRSMSSLAMNPASTENLSDPPPRSILPSSSSRTPAQTQEIVPSRLLLSPQPRSSEPKAPSSRRALTRALELAREAVQLDATNADPHGAVVAYGKSVALLSEVMERVRRGEDSTESSRRRNGRRRSVVAQEEEVKRLKSIHDTYADRMNILSVIYSIPPIPHSPSSVYTAAMSVSTASTQPSSPTSTSPLSESEPSLPLTARRTDHDPYQFGYASEESEGTASNNQEEETHTRSGSVQGYLSRTPPSPKPHARPPSAFHSYATQARYSVEAQDTMLPPLTAPNATRTRAGSISGRTRSGSTLPPLAPPPQAAPPPAPSGNNFAPEIIPSALPPLPHALTTGRSRGSSVSHKRTGSGSKLTALHEDHDEQNSLELQQQYHFNYEGDFAQPHLPTRELETPRVPVKRESHPLPPLPSPSTSSPAETPGYPSQQRESLSIPPETGAQPLINASTQMGTLAQRRSKISAPSSAASSPPAEPALSLPSAPSASRLTASSLPASTATSLGIGRSRAVSQPGRRPSVVSGRVSPMDNRPPMPQTASLNGSHVPRKASFPSKLNPNALPQVVIQSEMSPTGSISAIALVPPPPQVAGGLPTTPTSPLPPLPPTDSLRKPYHMMNLLRSTMTTKSGGYITRRLHVPQEVWSQGGAKLTNLAEKVRVVEVLCSALEDVQNCSVEYFGAGNVSSGMALGIGSISKKEGEAWLSKLEEFLTVCDGVVASFGKKLGVGEGFVLKKSTGMTAWGNKLTRRFGELTNGKNLDSPAAYVAGLARLFAHAQLLDEHTRALLAQPIAPAYAAFGAEIRMSAELKLKRSSEFFASVVLTFVIRDLSQLLDKYSKKCEKWLAE